MLSPLSLGNGEIHLWVVEPLDLHQEAQAAAGRLDPQELELARSMPEARGAAWRARRSALRRLLACYLGAAPERIPIIARAGGKPGLAGEAPRLHFNLSASGGWMVAAVCREQPVGVDIEMERQNLGVWTVARRYFSAGEIARLEAAEAFGTLQAEFLRLWTRKEARLKLAGEGLRGLEALAEEGCASQAQRAWVEDLGLGHGLHGAVALPLAPTWLRVRQFLELDLANAAAAQAHGALKIA